MNAIAADYERRANQHRPTDQALLAAEIQRLHQNGLSAHDIAGALRLGLSAVEQMLRTPSPAGGIDRSGTDMLLRDSTVGGRSNSLDHTQGNRP